MSYKGYEAVIELGNNKTKINSQIFVLDRKGTYKLDSNIVTVLDASTGIAEVTTTKNGKKSKVEFSFIEEAVIENEIDLEEAVILEELTFDNNEIGIMNNDRPGDGGCTWCFSHTLNSSTWFSHLTVAAVQTALSIAFPNWIVPIAVAAEIVRLNLTRVWNTTRVYYRYQWGVMTGERRHTWIYTDSFKTTLVPGTPYPVEEITNL